MLPRLTQFAAIVLTAVALVPAGAHLAELPGKIGMDRETYFAVQSIYRGWAFFGVALFGSLLANIMAAILTRDRWPTCVASLAAAILMAANLAIFFTWTFPTNQATQNWTVAPDNWRELRAQWEYSHAVNAVLTFFALCSATAAVLLDSGSRHQD